MDAPPGGWAELTSAILAGEYDDVLNEGSPVFPPDDRAAAPTVLALAARYAPYDVVEALLKRGAHPNLTAGFPEASARAPIAPLRMAASEGRRDVVDLLLSHGADPNLMHPVCGAVSNGDREMFETLIAAGAEVDFDLTEIETLLQMALGTSPTHESPASRAGITARIREIIAAKRTGPGRTLRSTKSKKKTAPTQFSAFARTRAGRDLSWIVFAVEGDPDGLADAIAPQGSKVEFDAANRRVIGCDAQYALQMKGSPWTWALVGHVGRRVAVFNFDADGFAAQLTTKLGRRVLAFKGFVVSDWKDGICTARHDLSPERMADDVGAKAVGKEHRELAYRRLDELCAAEGLRLPNMQDAGDGFEIVLEVFDCPESDVERLDVIVTR